jgi:phosphoglycerate dehydrogenase-like enzyme
MTKRVRLGSASLLQIGLCVSAVVLAIPASTARAGGEQLPDIRTVIEDFGLVASPTPSRDRPGWRVPRIVLVWSETPDIVAVLQSAAPDVEIVPVRDTADAVAHAADADAVIGLCDAQILAKGPQIRWVHSYWAGVEDCVAIPAVRERNILLTNMQRMAGPVMAEHVLAMMLAFARGLEFFIPERMAGRWTDVVPPPGRMQTLQGKTLLVVGLGGIGTEVAKRAHALGMSVIATRASGREGPSSVNYVGLPDELLKLASQADFIVNTTPLTSATTGIFDAKFFSAAKHGAYFFNVGRGRSVVQDDLIAALRSGQLSGAGLDVTEPEPLPADNPLWKMQNVLLTPHVAGDADEGSAARSAVVRENLRRYVAGEPLLSVVDLGRGY